VREDGLVADAETSGVGFVGLLVIAGIPRVGSWGWSPWRRIRRPSARMHIDAWRCTSKDLDVHS
jgi:hypothetical protein